MSKSAEDITSKVSNMRPGYYEIHILIESTTALSISKDSDLQPLIAVRAFGRTEYTKAKKTVGFEEVLWGQHIHFNKYCSEEDNVQQQTIVIEVWDHNKVLRNSLVGSYELNVQRIYSQNQHAIRNTWLALSDSLHNFGEIVGYIKMSVAVLGEKDSNVTLNMEALASIGKDKKILMPPHIERKSYQLTVDIFQGKNIRPADGETVDPYVGVQFGQIFQKTRTISKNCNPEWKERCLVPVHLPAIVDNIILRIIDVNLIQAKEVIGSYYLNINQLIKQSEGLSLLSRNNERWINFYGPQNEGSIQSARTNYQLYPNNAPYYVGSLLIQAKIQTKSSPVIQVRKMDDKYVVKPFVYYKIEADIDSAINLPSSSNRYRIGIRIGSHQIQTKQLVDCVNGVCSWNVHCQLIVYFYQNQPLPDTFVYLINSKGVKVCFIRRPTALKEGIVLDKNWTSFKPDLAIQKLSNEEAGYIRMGVKINTTTAPKDKEPMSSEVKIQNYFNASTKPTPCKLLINLICADSLLPSDDDGSTDPFFTFNLKGKQVCSSKKNSTLNPVYFEHMPLDGLIYSNNQIAPLMVKCYNQNPGSIELIGSCFIDLEKGLNSKNKKYDYEVNNQPQWFDLYTEGIKYGRFLASIAVTKNVNIKLAVKVDLPKKMYNLNLFILGLRGIKSKGIISIRKPYVQFDLDALSLLDQENLNQVTKNIKTEPCQSGSSINIKMPTKSLIKLPQNRAYWPTLSGKVKDYVIGGLYEPTLGYFSINLSQAFDRTQKLRDQFMKSKVIKSQKKVVRKVKNLQNIDQSLIRTLRNFIVKNVNYNWSIMDKKLPLNKIRGTSQMYNDNMVVVLPNYTKTDKNTFKERYRQIIEANGQYKMVGYDRKESLLSQIKTGCNKHYRFCLETSYQDYYLRVNKSKLGIYDQIPIKRGQVVIPQSSNDNFLTRLIDDEDLECGSYKGNCFITQNKGMAVDDKDDFQKQAANKLQSYMKETKVKMFLYILQAVEIPDKDIGSKSDPFIIVNLGGKEISFKDQYLEDNDEPQFNIKVVEDLNFPQNSDIEIQVWDYDPLGSNQFIGKTTINAQNRVFSQFGKMKYNNPIQTHDLKAAQTNRAQGQIRFWVDFVPYDQLSLYKQIDISNNMPVDFEVRIIVWGCSDINSDDKDITDMNDLYVACTFNGVTKETDVHLRTQNGEGSFNWRMLFPVRLPIKDPTISFKIYDKDFASGDQFLASGTIVIDAYLKEAQQNQAPRKLYLGVQDFGEDTGLPCSSEKDQNNNKVYDIFDIDLRNKQSDLEIESKLSGKVRVSIEVLPKSIAEARKVGQGRDAPNQYPKLPEPTGRMQVSLNPLVMLRRLVGKGLIHKVICAIICILLLLVGWYFIPSLLGSLVAKAI